MKMHCRRKQPWIGISALSIALVVASAALSGVHAEEREVVTVAPVLFRLAFSGDGAFLISGGNAVVTATVNANGIVDGQRMGPLVQLRDAKTGDIEWSTITAGAGDPDGIAVSPDGKLIAALVEQTIFLFDVETGQPVREIAVTE